MGVTDWGEINQPLGAPALGGAGGWADSVAKALNNSDQTVNARVNALEAAMEALIDTAQGSADAADANADARVAKAGDTMTGPLILSGAPAVANGAATKGYVDGVFTAAALNTTDWDPYPAAGYDPTIGFTKIGRLVVCQGLVATVSGDLAVQGVTIASGFPAPHDGKTHIFSTWSGGNQAVRVDMTSSGELVFSGYPSYVAGTNGDLSVEGISYLAAS